MAGVRRVLTPDIFVVGRRLFMGHDARRLVLGRRCATGDRHRVRFARIFGGKCIAEGVLVCPAMSAGIEQVTGNVL